MELRRGRLRVLKEKLLIVFIMVTILSHQVVSAKVLDSPSGLRDHHSYAVIDGKSGKLIMGEDANEKVYPASTTKIMTAIVMVEHKNFNLNKEITITSGMLKQVPACLSQYGLRAGQKYTLNSLLNMTLISSAGDATICAAIAIFGSVKNCVKAMNEKAEELGLTNTSFDNPAGLDIGDGYNNNYTTAYEMALITKYAMKNKTIRSIVAKKTYTVVQANGVKGHKIKNTNKFYSDVSYSENLYTIIGTKTGMTKAAGHVFAATAKDEKGHEVICVYMGRRSSTATFEDIRSILDKVFNSEINGKLELSDGKVDQVIKTENSYNLEYGQTSSFQLDVKVSSAQPLETGKSKHGKVSYKSSDEEILTVNNKGIVTIKNVGKVKITVSVAGNSTYKSAKKEIEISVNLAAAKNLISEVQEGGINISWDFVEGASGYYVFRKMIEEEEWSCVLTTKENEYMDTSCTEDESYEYKIVAYSKTSSGKIEGKSSEVIEVIYQYEEEPVEVEVINLSTYRKDLIYQVLQGIIYLERLSEASSDCPQLNVI